MNLNRDKDLQLYLFPPVLLIFSPIVLPNIQTVAVFQGAQLLTASSSLCEVTCSDASKYIISCGVRGQLIEVNENLLTSPHLLSQKVNNVICVLLVNKYFLTRYYLNE